MSRYIKRHRMWTKAIAMVVVCLFTLNTVSWAYPGGSVPASNDTLQVQFMFNSMIRDKGEYYQRQLKAEIKWVIEMAERKYLYHTINSELNKLSHQAGWTRVIDVQPVTEGVEGEYYIRYMDDPAGVYRYRMTVTDEGFVSIKPLEQAEVKEAPVQVPLENMLKIVEESLPESRALSVNFLTSLLGDIEFWEGLPSEMRALAVEKSKQIIEKIERDEFEFTTIDNFKNELRLRLWVQRIKQNAPNSPRTVAINVHTPSGSALLDTLRGKGIGFEQGVVLVYSSLEENQFKDMAEITPEGHIKIKSVHGELNRDDRYINDPETDVINALFSDGVPEHVILVGEYYGACHFRTYWEIARYCLAKKRKTAFHLVGEMIAADEEKRIKWAELFADMKHNKKWRGHNYYWRLKKQGHKVTVYINGEKVTSKEDDGAEIELYYWSDLGEGRLEKMQSVMSPGRKAEEAEAGGDELGAQVSNIQKLDRLLKLLRLLKKDNELLEEATDRDIIEYVIEHLDEDGLIEETSYSPGLKIIKIKDEAKETLLGKAIERWAIRPAGGVKAINFQGKDGVWTIVGFSSELTDPATLEHEKKEIAYRRQGYTWWQAHERVEEGRNPYEEIKNRSERRIPDVERIILSRGVSVQKAEDLDGLVEEPLLEACKILFEKNIDTISTTANETNLQYLLNDDGGHYATISVNYDRLFPENKVIADDLVDGRRNLENIRFYRAIDEGLRMTPTLLIRIPITYETTIQEVHEKAVRVANLFKKQKYIPSDVRTLGEFRKLLGDPEATVEMFQEDGYYYDEENELIWSSREDYEKSLESVEEPSSSSGALTHGEEIGAAGREEAVFNFSIIGKGFKSLFKGRDVHVRGINAETRRIRNYVSALRVRTAEEKAVVPTVIKAYVPVARIDNRESARAGKPVFVRQSERVLPGETLSILREAHKEGYLELFELNDMQDYRQAAEELNVDEKDFSSMPYEMPIVFVSEWNGPNFIDFLQENSPDAERAKKAGKGLGSTLKTLHQNGLICDDTHLKQYVVNENAGEVLRIDLVNISSVDKTGKGRIQFEYTKLSEDLSAYPAALEAFKEAYPEEEMKKLVSGTPGEEVVPSASSPETAQRRTLSAKEKREVRERIEAANRQSRNDALDIISEYLANESQTSGESTPVDIVIDLSLLSEKESELEKNAETWAYLILMCYNLKNVRFRFQLPDPSEKGDVPEGIKGDANDWKKKQEVFLRSLEAKLEAKKVFLSESINVKELLKERVNNFEERKNKIEIPILSKAWLKWMWRRDIELKDYQYPVALDQITTTKNGEVALRNFAAALTIGLSKAALVIAKRRDEEKGAEEELPKLIGEILAKLKPIYNAFKKDISERTLRNMVYPDSATRLHLAISLALPPIVRMPVGELQAYHLRIHAFLQAA